MVTPLIVHVANDSYMDISTCSTCHRLLLCNSEVHMHMMHAALHMLHIMSLCGQV